MVPLTQLLAHHRRILVLDAASTRVQVGLVGHGSPPVWRSDPREAGESLFTLTNACLREAALELRDVDAFVFCSGPGSMLGVRIVAMALRTWQALQPRPAYQYLSLALLAHEIAASDNGRPALVIADARRETWHSVAILQDGKVEPAKRLSAEDLASTRLPLWQSSAFRAWSAPPRPTRDCAYDIAALWARHAGVPLLSPSPEPDTFQHEAPTYKKWTGQVHTAAQAPRPQ